MAAEDIHAKEKSPGIPRRTLGRTGEKVSILGLGGVYIPGGDEQNGTDIVNRALDLGINYIDTASQYGNRESERRIGLVMKTRRKEVFLATKTLKRRKEESLEEIEESLRLLQTDVIDLIQLHSINDDNTLNLVTSDKGALQAAIQMKEKGYVRHIGITGHTRPEVISRALDIYPFDTILVALGVADEFVGSFLEETVPKANKKGVGIIAMKVLSEGKTVGRLPVDKCLLYAMGLPVTAAIVGMSTPKMVEENAAVAHSFKKLNSDDLTALRVSAKELGTSANLWWKRT